MSDEKHAWYCVHTRPKCEHIAAGVLRSLAGVEPWCPRIRFQRGTRRGKVWFVEALFPSYFFARFDPGVSLRAVRHSQNVIRVVEFGGVPTEIPDSVIATLRNEMAESDLVEVRIGLKVGDTVELTEGPMRGFQGIVNGVMSGEERVSVLLDFLGRQSLVQVEVSKLISDAAPRVVAAGR